MFRLVTASRVIREAVPPELVGVFWVVTLLGSAKFLIGVLSLAYWNWGERREQLLALVGVGFLALTVTLVLKYGLDMPRPPESVQRYPIEPSPVGFPSGHAIAATVFYGGGLLALERHRDRRAVLAATVAVLAVGLSRVVLGVHYLGDVVAGFAVGLLVLTALGVTLEYGAVYAFGGAVVLSVPALVVTNGNADAVLALGGSLGGVAGAALVPGATDLCSRAERALLNVAGGVFVVTAVLAGEVVAAVPALAAGANFLLTFGIIALPWSVSRVASLGTGSTSDR